MIYIILYNKIGEMSNGILENFEISNNFCENRLTKGDFSCIITKKPQEKTNKINHQRGNKNLNLYKQQLLTVVPVTGDEGFEGILIGVIAGVLLLGAFALLTVAQKLRKNNNNQDIED